MNLRRNSKKKMERNPDRTKSITVQEAQQSLTNRATHLCSVLPIDYVLFYEMLDLKAFVNS